MGLSFEDSLKAAQAEAASTSPLSVSSEEDYAVMTLDDTSGMIAAYSGDEGWEKPVNASIYTYYDGEYGDEDYSVVDEAKNITLSQNQINLTQETNSQYIPFKIPRYYDQFDLSETEITIYWVNKNLMGSIATPVDVYCNSEYIKFAWLIDGNVTQFAGKIEFEIQARGVNSKGLPYLWKTKANDGLNVIQALEVKTFIEPNNKWSTDFIDTVTTAAQEAKDAAAEAKQVAADLQDGIAAEVQTAMGDNYYTKTEVDEAIANADVDIDLTNYAKVEDIPVVPTNVSAFTNDAGYLTEHQDLSAYATTEYVDAAVESVDVSDQIGDIGENDNVVAYVDAKDAAVLSSANATMSAKVGDIGENITVKQYVDTAVEYVDISDQLGTLTITDEEGNEVDATVEEYVNAKVADVDVDLTGYATETYVDNKIDVLSADVTTNKTNVSTLNTTVANLQSTVNGIDTSPRLTYDVAYNDTEDENVGANVFVLYEIENEGEENEVREAKKKFTIVGGSGGNASGSSLKIGYVTTSPLVVTTNDEAIIKYTFSGIDSSEDAVTEGTATWKVAGRIVATNTAIAGENSFDVTEYLSVGTQKVNLSIVDESGSLVTKTWTVQKIDVRLESTFNDKLTYPVGTVSFDYTPYGAISKDVHFILDGVEIGTVTTTSSGIPMAFEIPAQEHGAHLLDVYMTATINNNNIESNHITKDIIWYDETSTVPVISTVYQDFTARQYDATNIEYTVYDPTTETPTVEIAVDGNVVSTPTLSSATNVYTFKTDVVGEHVITITCGETVKTLSADITELDIDVEPVTAGLVFDFNPSGKSNNDVDRVWTDGTVSMSVSDNFDWINGGYQYDKSGDQYFCIKAGTSANIDYQLFADDAKKNGKEFKLVFKTTNVAKPDATFLSCIDNTIDTDHIGIQMDVHEANIYGQAGSLNLPYSEEDIIEFEFNISKNTEAVPMVMGYEDGVSTRPMVYDDSYNFTQNTPKVISLGSEDCDLHIYRFKVYNTSLTDRGILNNFIADARNAEEMISRYERNDIYDENQNLDPDVLAEKCPWLRVYKLSAPYFTNNKSDKVPYTTIQQIYKDGDPVLDNWTCYDCSHSGQGTSSNNYGAAGRNLDFIMNKSQREGVKPYFILGDGSEAKEITLTRTSVPVAYLNAKVNIASSNNLTNAMLAGRYNEFKPYSRPFVREEGIDTSFIKDTMEFYNAVIFIQETNEDLTTHREFADNDWHFYSMANIGDSKKSDFSRLTDQSDKYECCIEIMDVELPLSDFPTDTMMNAMGYKEDETTHEKIYIWAKNENLGILYEKINGEYVLTADTEVDLTKTYYVDILEHDDFSEDFTYGWRYLYEGDDDEENAEVFNYCKQKWIEAYRFITTSTDEEFKAHIGDYFNLDTVLYYYLFTTRYCMVDNRAKNCFLHYTKTGEVDSDGNPIRKWSLDWMYDCDTALGLNNYGKQVYRYGLEDTDVDEKGEEVFREMDSQLFCRIRDLFPSELKSMYQTLESKNAWHAESFINKADEWQSQFPEELWRLDIERKYLRTYNSSFINGKGDDQFLKNMANGKMKYHRRQWERNQEQYMASKYQSNTASSDDNSVVMRCTAPSGDLVIQPNYKLKLTPYAYMYLNVEYSTGVVQIKAEPNIEYEIPFTGDKTDIIKVYSASCIQSLGDLSPCYLATISAGTAGKLKELIIGNSTEGYDNPYFTTLTTGANYLLEKLNVENVSGLTQSLNLSALSNLRELYAHGSNASGVTFADGGKIEIAELPAINAISMKNLMYLATLDIVDFSKLTTLTVENCNTVDLVTILNNSPNINRVRITGVNWTLDDTSLLERLYAMKGIDNGGYNTDKSILAGKVFVPVIKQQQLYEYQQAWPDLEITFNTMQLQYAVTFVNDDGTVLDIQYVVEGEDAVDPITREDNPISTPTKESTVSTDFTFAGWDSVLTSVFSERTIKATYTESTRSYTIKYVSKGITLQESTGLYGENVIYTGTTPTYALEESAYKYYLFNRWDKSGFIDGDKTVTAMFDEFKYTEGCFEGRELADLSPVEIYALTKLGVDNVSIGLADGDDYAFTMGYDIDYDDIESETIISEKTSFTGSNYLDTGIKLFDEDRDFVLAIDYEMSSNISANGVLAQCFQSNGSNGIKLYYNSGVKFAWGSTSITPTSTNCREMIVIRHKKGDNKLYVYNSNLASSAFALNTMERTKSTIISDTLVFGCAKPEENSYENYGIGDIHWCKVWYKDLGESVCEKLAGWTHEEINMEICGFKKYYLTENPSKRCNFTLLATHLLERARQYNTSNTSVGGWASSPLNAFLNSRFYNAMPTQIKSLVKKVTVWSSIGNMSTEVSSSECYVAIPAIIELSNETEVNKEPYTNEGTTISYMTSNDMRKRAYVDGDYDNYWTRSPNVGYATYIYQIKSDGGVSGYNLANENGVGVLIEISF